MDRVKFAEDRAFTICDKNERDIKVKPGISKERIKLNKNRSKKQKRKERKQQQQKIYHRNKQENNSETMKSILKVFLQP